MVGARMKRIWGMWDGEGLLRVAMGVLCFFVLLIGVAGAQETQENAVGEAVSAGSEPAVETAVEPAVIVGVVRIETVEVTGNTLIGSEEIAGVLKGLLPMEGILSSGGSGGSLEKLPEAVTGLYRSKGYFLVQAYLPEQEIKDGVLKVKVLEGALGRVTVSGNDVYATLFIRNHFKEEGDTGLQRAGMERALLLLNDYMDMKATGLFETGREEGRADLNVRVTDERPLHFRFDYNNFGSKLVSRHRFGIGMDMGNVVRTGSVLSIRSVVGSPVTQAVYGSAGYSLPLDFNGTRLAMHLSGGDFDIGKSLAVLNIGMETMGWGVSVSHPIRKSSVATLVGEVGFDAQDFSQSFGVSGEKTRDRVRKLWGQMDYSKQRGRGRDILGVSLHQGLGGVLGGTTAKQGGSRVGANNSFTRGVLEAARFQEVTEMISVMVRGVGQGSLNDLVVGEQMSLGGPDSIRGYAVGEFLGDSGYSFHAEMRVMPLKARDVMQVVFFADHGDGYIKKGVSPLKGSLSGAGFGVRSHLTKEKSGVGVEGKKKLWDADVRADVGYPLRDGPYTKVGAAYYLQALLRY